jgi:DNA-binding CsgD family transcriptional regulator
MPGRVQSRTCLLLISDTGLEIAIRSVVEMLSGVVCETLSLNRLASLTGASDRGLSALFLDPGSFLIVDARTEKLAAIQPLMRRLRDRVVRIASSGNKNRSRMRRAFQLDPEAPLLEVVESLRDWLDPSGETHPSGKPGQSPIKDLGIRETQILELLATGKRYVDIAETLRISVDTVRSHLRRIYPRLGVQSRTAAVSVYLRRRGRREGDHGGWTSS